MRFIIYSIFLLLVSFNVVAAPFDYSPTDKSVEILGLFGNIGTMIAGKDAPAITAVFEKFNTAILTVSIIVLGYITIVSLINTAQEGTVMGKKWSSAWIPLKSILGIFLLLPITTHGYSIVQAMVMWIVLQGVGFADGIWGTILDYLGKGISVTGETRINAGDIASLQTTTKNIFKDMLVSATCAQTILSMQQGKAPSDYASVNKSDPSINSDLTINYAGSIKPFNIINTSSNKLVTGELLIGVNEKNSSNTSYRNVCGKFSITADSSTKSKKLELSAAEQAAYFAQGKSLTQGASSGAELQATRIYSQKVAALSRMYDDAKRIAKAIVESNTTVTVTDLANQSIVGWRLAAERKFFDMLSGQVIPYQQSNFIQNVVKSGKQAGWAVAGSYYFLLYRSEITNLYETVYNQGHYVYTAPNVKDYLKPDENKYYDYAAKKSSDYEKDPNSNKDFSGLTETSVNPFNFGSQGWFLNSIVSEIQKGIYKLWVLFVKDAGQVEKVSEPLVSMALIGQAMMTITETLWVTVTIGALAFTTIGAFAGISFGFLSVIAGLFTVVTVLMAILGILYVTGIALGIYLPMLPYLIYTAAILGWAMLVIEAVVGAPLIALGVIVPSQSEMGRAGGALTILGNIFLRPALMVIAFVFSAKLLAAIIKFVQFGFFTTITYVFNLGTDAASTGLAGGGILGVGTPPGFLSPLFAIVIYVAFIIAIANRIFNLIHMLPDKIMRWIGGAAETVGQEVGAITQKAQQEFDKSAGEASKTMSGMATKGMESISNKIESDKKKKEDSGGSIV